MEEIQRKKEKLLMEIEDITKDAMSLASITKLVFEDYKDFIEDLELESVEEADKDVVEAMGKLRQTIELLNGIG